MLIVTDHETIRLADPVLQHLLSQRLMALQDPESDSARLEGLLLVVVEPGDTADSIAAVTDYSIFQNWFEETTFRDPDFVPGFDCLEDQGCYFEIVSTLK